MDEYIRPAWAEIDLDSLAHNIRQIRKFVGPEVRIMGVVKCDAYGTGTAGIIDTLLEEGIYMLGVAVLDEALALRQRGITAPILVFGYTPFEHCRYLVQFDISQSVYCREQAAALSLSASGLGKKATVHLEIDTGMGRLGFQPTGEAVRTICEIAKMPLLDLEGIYTHCPLSNERNEEGIGFTEQQHEQFRRFVGELESRSIAIPLKHACNSMGTLYYRHMHMDMVRAGIILYGSYPLFQKVLSLKPVLSLKTQIAFIKQLGPGKNVGYGRQFITGRNTTVATLPLGYGDGYSRLLSNKGAVLVKGQRAPVIGSICMDQCMIDITDIEGRCRIGEEVVVIGRQGKEEVTIEELSTLICGFVSYEYMLLIHRRVPRVYKKGDKIVRIINNLLERSGPCSSG